MAWQQAARSGLQELQLCLVEIDGFQIGGGRADPIQPLLLTRAADVLGRVLGDVGCPLGKVLEEGWGEEFCVVCLLCVRRDVRSARRRKKNFQLQ